MRLVGGQNAGRGWNGWDWQGGSAWGTAAVILPYDAF
jgi:hypothetical protein